jgi:uncharacterized protein
VGIEPLSMGGGTYVVEPAVVPVLLDVARIAHGGYSLRLRFTATPGGPCMRCLGPAAPSFDIDAREVWQPGEGEELTSPYVDHQVVDLRSWARDALVLAVPSALVCRADCPGLCPVCGVNLDEAGPDHVHERPIDSRWAKLSELRFD